MLNKLVHILTLLAFFSGTYADQKLYSNSLVSCLKNNTNIVPNYFSVVFDAQKKNVEYDISLTSKLNAKLKAYATIYAFGFDIIHETINLCDLNLKQFCPITPSSMEVESIESIPAKYVDMIPNIAYTFPDLDAVARLIITDENNELLGCLQASFDNGKTVAHSGVKWATAVIAGIGLLASAILSLFGNSASASRMSAAAISLFTYFQSIVIISMIAVEEVPPIANSWAENLAWSMGLIKIEFMQTIFRWYVQATGGVPTQYLTTEVKSILTQRSLDGILSYPGIRNFKNYLSPLTSFFQKRDSSLDDEFTPLDDVESNNYLLVLRGIKRIGYDAEIEPTSIACTGFTFFIIFLYVLLAIYGINRYLSKVLTKGEKKSWVGRNLEYRTSWQPTFKGILLRYIYIGYPQLLILSLWEFTVVDSGAVVTIAVLFLILSIGTLLYSCIQVLRYAKLSIQEHGNPAAILYGNPDVLNKYGFLYTMLNAKKYWFCAVSLGYVFIKAFFVGLAQDSGKTQAMALWILDMVYLGLMCHYLPYLDKFTNVLSVFLQVITTINSFFFTFYSGIYNTPPQVAAVMGLVFFIMNAAVSLILLVVCLILTAVTIISKNPDARFSPTKDDRTSFQRKHKSIDENTFNNDDNELFALGQVAKEHDTNWEDQMYNLNGHGDGLKSSEDNLYEQEDSFSSEHGLSRLMSKLTRGKSVLGSIKRKASKSNKTSPTKELPKPDNFLSPSDNFLSPPDTSEDNVHEDLIDQLEHEDGDYEDNNDPFLAANSSRFENPFDTPYKNHVRNESHISGVTNGTTGGLSVFGERISTSNDKFSDIESEENIEEAHRRL